MLERGHKRAPLVEALLTALAAAKWNHSRHDPLPPALRDRVDPVAQLRQIVRRLKRALKRDWLDFHVHELVVSWEDRVKTKRAMSTPNPQPPTPVARMSAPRAAIARVGRG